MADPDQITIPLSLLRGPTPQGEGTVGIGNLAQIKAALVERFGQERADQAWPQLERLLVQGIQAAQDGQTEGMIKIT